MKTFFTTKPHAGFTLIETLVAIFIFSTALVALSGIAARGVSSVNRAKEVVVAEYLAQEGLEMVRNVRDNTTLAGGAVWDDGFAGSTDCVNNSCDISYQNFPLIECGSVCNTISIYNGIYSGDATGGTGTNSIVPTGFVRTIKVRPFASDTLGNPIEYAVFSTVTWPVGVGQRSVQVTTMITDWQLPY